MFSVDLYVLHQLKLCVSKSCTVQRSFSIQRKDWAPFTRVSFPQGIEVFVGVIEEIENLFAMAPTYRVKNDGDEETAYVL